MARTAEQKLKILYLLKILSERSDEEHPLTIKDIQTELERYGITAERKSLYDDIAELRNFGVNIETIKSRSFAYYIAERDFQLPELKLLVDSVQCAKFLTPKKTNDLIKKIENLTSVYEASSLQRQVYVKGRVKTQNEQIYITTDLIHDAISANKQISFKYYVWQVDFSTREKVKRVFRRDGATYTVSPWALTWEDENYYLIAYDSAEGKTKHFRVDKMAHINIIEKSFRDGAAQFKNFDIASYCTKSFGMFGGTEEDVRVIFDNHLIGVVVDRFGTDIFISKVDDEHFSAVLKATISPVFISWLLSFGNQAKVVSPDHVVELIKNQVDDIRNMYE